MIVYIKSMKRAGELVSIGFTETKVGGLNINMELVSETQPLPLAVIALEDRFVYGPLGDFIPIWSQEQLNELMGVKNEKVDTETFTEKDVEHTNTEEELKK